MATNSSTPYLICGPRGQKLFPSPSENAAKYRPRSTLARNIKQAISQYDHAEKVTLCAQISARISILSAAIRQKNEWAFPGDSWQPIFYGGEENLEWEKWGEIVTDWLTHTVFPNAIRCNVRKDLLWGLRVSGMAWDRHGDDLAVFSLGANNLPQMTVIPGTRIGNGSGTGFGNQSVQGSTSTVNADGFSIVQGGRFDGYRIYNGIIFDGDGEPIAARVLGVDRDGKEKVADLELGLAHGTHLASEYEWHEMGRPLPRMATDILQWLDKEEIDDLFLKGIKLAATKTLIHKLAEGQSADEARGSAAGTLTIPGSQTESGEDETIYYEQMEGGDATFIGSAETLEGLDFKNPHPNVEDFANRKLREALNNYGFPLEFMDLSSGGRAPSRLACKFANNSIWQKQSTGEQRLLGFLKFSIANGVLKKQIPEPPAGPLDEHFKWTFGYPQQITVDEGNDNKAELDRLRHGLTSQRILSANWGYVQKRIDKDRMKEAKALVDRAVALKNYAKDKGLDMPDQRCIEFFYMPSANAGSLPNEPKNAAAETKPKPAKEKAEG